MFLLKKRENIKFRLTILCLYTQSYLKRFENVAHKSYFKLSNCWKKSILVRNANSPLIVNKR